MSPFPHNKNPSGINTFVTRKIYRRNSYWLAPTLAAFSYRRPFVAQSGRKSLEKAHEHANATNLCHHPRPSQALSHGNSDGSGVVAGPCNRRQRYGNTDEYLMRGQVLDVQDNTLAVSIGMSFRPPVRTRCGSPQRCGCHRCLRPHWRVYRILCKRGFGLQLRQSSLKLDPDRARSDLDRSRKFPRLDQLIEGSLPYPHKLDDIV